MIYRVSLLPFIIFEVCLSALFIMFFGFGNFLIFLLLSVLIGIILLAIFWKNMLEFQFLAPKEMFAQFAYVICAFLFLIPGILSSVLGFLILIFALIFRGKKTKAQNFKNENSRQYDEEFIDVEIIEDRK